MPLLWFTVPPLGGRKGKPFPNFSKTGRPVFAILIPFDTAQHPEEIPGICPSYYLGGRDGVPPNLTKKFENFPK